jgi:8-oxo-dGTP pyrophosphatase MutT (NUDIX family)
MNLEPQKFFIGLLDFFSILLPGALLTYVLMEWVGFHRLEGTEDWAVFLFASYLLGHIVFLAGSWLDDFYDWVRGYTLNTQIEMLTRRGNLLRWPCRALIWLVFKRERNLAVDRASAIKRQTLGPLRANDAINTFQWCKALLNIESPASFALVERLEADSKFFRSFTVVLVLLLVLWPLQQIWLPEGVPIASERAPVAFAVAFVLLLLALWRYMEQRFKSTNQAYWSVITLTASKHVVVRTKAKSSANSPTHAGGVVVWERGGVTKYLLVEATKNPNQWVLPKGHIDEPENPCETAVREVLEETGVWARIVDWDPGILRAELDDVSYLVGEDRVIGRFYLMQAVGQGRRKDPKRQHEWLPLQKAIERAHFAETKNLLQSAENVRVALHGHSNRSLASPWPRKVAFNAATLPITEL